MLDLPPLDEPPFADAVAVWSSARPVVENDGPTGKALTIWVHLENADRLPVGEMVGWRGLGESWTVRIHCALVAEKPMLVATVMTDVREQPLGLLVPASMLESDSEHVLVFRYAGHRLELWIDGVLADEEWPMGSLRAAVGSMEVGGAMRGHVRQVAWWDRALSNQEVMLLSAGSAGRAERERRILGVNIPVGQFWLPRGYNVHVGDCMPFFHDGRFHLFYLRDRRNHGSKWGLGAHEWAHLSTTDLIKWEEHPLAIAITEESEGSICTGSVVFHGGAYHAFYSVRMADGSAAPLCVATSEDGINFVKQPPLAHLTAPYQSQPARDPLVFFDALAGRCHMLVTTSLASPAVAGRGGCLARLVSDDLRQWEQCEPFLVTDLASEPECPDYFAWRGWYYLIFSLQGVAHYRMSRHPLGPWQKPGHDIFDGPDARVMKTAAFTGDRRIGVAFVPRARDVYGGRVIFRELTQRPDGSLATHWPPELKPSAVGP